MILYNNDIMRSNISLTKLTTFKLNNKHQIIIETLILNNRFVKLKIIV